MKFSEAPPAGWYPDPRNRSRLRWWDGLDWTDIRRAPPSDAELASFEAMQEELERARARADEYSASVPGRPDTDQVISQVRSAARSEIDRAADVFTQRARQATREATSQIQPLISQYTAPAIRWIRIAAIVAVVLLVAYFLFQVFAQASLLEWLGDRIDNLTDENSLGAALSGWPPA